MARALPRVTESQHQQALFEWWAIACRRYGLPEKALYHVPNEGKRSFSVAARLKAEGMRSGVPDIVLAAPRGNYGALYIELKTAKGRPTAEQLDYIDALRECGNAAQVCYGWDEARRVVEAYLDGREIPLR